MALRPLPLPQQFVRLTLTAVDFDAERLPHRRFNPLSGEYVLVSPQRTARPWQGQEAAPARERGPAYDPTCYLCPGNERAGGKRNPDYTSTYVFTNDFPALLPEVPAFSSDEGGFFQLDAASGTCRVICYDPRHDLTLADMSPGAIRRVVDLWAEQVSELEQVYRYVQVFESKGEVVGTSNAHPHGQLWAGDFLPTEVAKEDLQQRDYFVRDGEPLLLAYANAELARTERVVEENEHWLVVVPFWAYWPFETLVLPRRAVQRMPDLTSVERTALAEILKSMLTRFDSLFEVPFPYLSGWHGAPSGDHPHWQLHGHYYPPLLRSATVQKFVASYEWLAEAQRDLTAEEAARRLRAVRVV